MALGQILEKTFYQERQTSTGINFLEISWLTSSYLAKEGRKVQDSLGGPWRKRRLEEILKEPFKTYWDGRCWSPEQQQWLLHQGCSVFQKGSAPTW